ncbi:MULTISPECIES: hypothetical protein [Pandoraea]|uniref:Uncharacterized protein n=1 Tax=Pandoraea terrigena TaxID=2508292 RepID=A0A5E4YV10_9BURK|nr:MULTISPECIES: hypothetical protein [Pandoraea]CFB60455.1 hypothetical protein LMG16407_00494 [Pandoraea apista]VVE52699.1 hypothetical protein PTE31013_04834 [Pandoraea terrigena]
MTTPVDEDDDGIETSMFYSVIGEMERVWGEPGLDGTSDEYKWLEANYQITEEEDVKWQMALQYFVNHDLPEDDESDPEVMAFLDDYDAVRSFLAEFLRKYRSSDKVYLRPSAL